MFEDVTFHYGGHRAPLYDGLSVDIRAGERVGLVGRSGSGKTTFVKLVQRLYDVNGGRILIDGQDIAEATQHSLRSQIAIVQQEPILFHRSLAENIAYGRPGASMAAIEQAARLANAHDFILRLPKGYGTLVGERGVKLSGGERQRVALARAFLADAPVLILDEATSSLDSESEALIQQAMERLMKGRTSIVIAHRLSTVRSLDRILVFDRGEIVEQGTHAALAGATGRHLSRAVRAAGDRVRFHLGGGVRVICHSGMVRRTRPGIAMCAHGDSGFASSTRRGMTHSCGITTCRLAALLAAIALSFLVNMMFVVVSRTALVTMPIMLAVFALLHLRLRTAIAALCAAALLAAVVWNVSPQLRATVAKFFTDYQYTAIQGYETGMGSRLLYWQKSLRFFAEAPVIGHGTGSTRGLFEQAAIGEVGARAQIVTNPHNQTLNVAVQWGAIGVVVLYAIWLVHLLLFRGDGLAAWIGLMVVVQNVSTSLFNSHLFDFHEGWMYVLGVGVAGGMVLGAGRGDRLKTSA